MSMSTPINQIRNQNQNQNQGEQPNMPLMPPVYNPTVDVQLPGQNLNNSSDPSASNASHTQLVEDILNEMEDNPSVGQLDDINTSNFNYATDDVNVPPKKNMNSINNLKAEPTTQFDSNDEQILQLKNRWEKNVYNIFNTIIKALKISDEMKVKMIHNNYAKINNNFNKNKYYNNINEILSI